MSTNSILHYLVYQSDIITNLGIVLINYVFLSWNSAKDYMIFLHGYFLLLEIKNLCFFKKKFMWFIFGVQDYCEFILLFILLHSEDVVQRLNYLWR